MPQERLAEWRAELVADVKKFLRPVTRHRSTIERARYGNSVMDAQAGNDFLAEAVHHPPSAVARFGASELGGARYWLRHRNAHGVVKRWSAYHQERLYKNAGVFPNDPVILSRFCEFFLEEVQKLDVLGVWYFWGEREVQQRFAPNARLMPLVSLEPYYHLQPWSAGLAGKRVLVVSPFARSIEVQHRRREQVWRKYPQVMPDFSLRTVRVPLSAALTRSPEHADWFAAMEAMKKEMAAEPFDVAIIGAGAWGLPLATYAKSLGAWGLHLGGPTQLLFGVMGRRWEDRPLIMRNVNDAWVRPGKSETPPNPHEIENACYW